MLYIYSPSWIQLAYLRIRCATFDLFLNVSIFCNHKMKGWFKFCTSGKRACDILQQCGRVQQWLKRLLAHHISVCVSPVMWLKWMAACFLLYIYVPLLLSRRGHDFYKTDWFLRVKTQTSINQDFSPRGRREKAWGGVISTVHAPIWPIVELRNIVPQVNKGLSGK